MGKEGQDGQTNGVKEERMRRNEKKGKEKNKSRSKNAWKRRTEITGKDQEES